MIGDPKQTESAKILMITPYHQSQRGNSITTARIRTGLAAAYGYHIDLVSLENPHWRELLAKAITDCKYGLLHGFNAWRLGQLLQACPIADKIPFILTTTGTDIHHYLFNEQRAAVEYAMQAARKIILFNDSFRSSILQTLPQMEDKIVVIPQGVHLDPITPRRRPDLGFTSENIIFLLPSGLRPIKNISLAIEALSRLHSDYPQVRLVIIGGILDSAYGTILLKQINTLDWITYLGEVPHQQMGSIMALGDVVLNTSLSEGQPQAALEAMSLGLPAIFTAVPGNLNLIQNGVEGFYVQDEEELHARAQHLLENEALRKSMGLKAKELILKCYKPEDEIKAYKEIYQLFINPY